MSKHNTITYIRILFDVIWYKHYIQLSFIYEHIASHREINQRQYNSLNDHRWKTNLNEYYSQEVRQTYLKVLFQDQTCQWYNILS